MTAETELQMVQRHVREGAATVLRQSALVAHIASAGRDTAAAEALLQSFEAIQGEHLAHLERITLREGRPDAGWNARSI